MTLHLHPGMQLMRFLAVCWSRSPVAGLAPNWPSVVHGRPPGSLHRMQVLEGNGAIKKLVGNHGECIHVHLRISSSTSISCWGAKHRCLDASKQQSPLSAKVLAKVTTTPQQACLWGVWVLWQLSRSPPLCCRAHVGRPRGPCTDSCQSPQSTCTCASSSVSAMRDD